MRAQIWMMVVAIGCGHPHGGGPGSEGSPDAGIATGSGSDAWTISFDMSALNRYVQPVTSTSWTYAGSVAASDGLASVTVDGSAVAVTGAGAFSMTVAVAPGLTPVAVLATDAQGHTQKGDRTLLSARFLADGAINAQAAAVVVDDAMLAAMGSGVAAQAGDIDVAGLILAMPTLSSDSQCTTWPTAATQGAVKVALSQQAGALALTITVPDLDVQFDGQCQGLLSEIPLAGEMQATLVVTRPRSPRSRPPPAAA